MRIDGITKEKFRSVEIRKVIFLITLVGEGTEEDPVRELWRILDHDTGEELVWREK